MEVRDSVSCYSSIYFPNIFLHIILAEFFRPWTIIIILRPFVMDDSPYRTYHGETDCNAYQMLAIPCPYKMMQNTWKKLQKPWHMGTHLIVLSESFSMHTNMTGLDGYLKSLHPCTLDESSLSIGRVKYLVKWPVLQQGLISLAISYHFITKPIHACSSQNRLAMSVISLQQKQFSENIWRKFVIRR